MRKNRKMSSIVVYKCHWCGVREEVPSGEKTRREWACLAGWPWCGCTRGKTFKKMVEICERRHNALVESDQYDWELDNL